MMFVSIVGHASFHTVGTSGPSMIERSYLRRCCVADPGRGGSSVVEVAAEPLGVGGAMARAGASTAGRVTSSIYDLGGNSTGGERGSFLVSYLSEADVLLTGAKCLEDSVDAVAGETENRVYSPSDESLDEKIGRRCCHSHASSAQAAATAARKKQCHYA